MAGDALTQFGYVVGVELNSTVTPLSSKLDTVISLLSSTPASTSRMAVGVSTATINRIATPTIRKQRQGMCAKTGRLLTGVDHLKQSIADILHTRIGLRVMRRTYGSNLFERIDQPQNDLTRVGIMADIAEVLDKWEPRFQLKQVKLTGTTDEQSNGKLFCTLRGDYNGAEISVGVSV